MREQQNINLIKNKVLCSTKLVTNWFLTVREDLIKGAKVLYRLSAHNKKDEFILVHTRM